MSLLNTLATAARAAQENFINDFTAETLKLLGFNERGTTVSTRYVIPFTMCGEANRVAQTDMCLIHRPTSILLVQTPSNRTNAEAQVIAESIAAFQFNNRKRSERGLDPLDAMTIPVIPMTGTCPTSCLVPITLELSDAVISGQHPVIQTHLQRASIGMGNTEYRKLTLKRFLAFKTLAKSHWIPILEGV